MKTRYFVGAGLIVALVGCGWDSTAIGGQPTKGIQRSGPFVLGGPPEQRLTVLAAYEEGPPDPDPDRGRTLESWTVKDATGATLSHESRDVHRMPDGQFEYFVSLGAHVVKGARKNFLLLQFYEEPSAPLGGTTYVFYGFDRKGRFRRLGEFVRFGDGVLNKPARDGIIALAQGRFVDLGVWLYRFGMKFRYEYDEARDAFVARNRCSAVADPLTARAAEHIAELVENHANTLTLFARATPTAPTRQITLAPTAKIDYLQACVDAPPAPGPPGDLTAWLHVRIDGREGWVREPDFERLGLEEAG